MEANRQRLNNSKINKIDPEFILRRLSECRREKTVENSYVQFYTRCCLDLYVTNGILPGRSVDDGLIEFNYTLNTAKNKVETFYIQQECKFEKNHFGRDIYAQLSQALHYRYLYKGRYNIKGVILNSEKYFAVIYYKDIQDIIEDIDKKFASLEAEYTPSKSYDIVKQLKREFFIDSKVEIIDHSFELHTKIEEIYKHCLEPVNKK